MKTIEIDKSKKSFDSIYSICLNSQAISFYILACFNNGVASFNELVLIPRGDNKSNLSFDPKQISTSFISGSIPESLTLYIQKVENNINYQELEKNGTPSFDISCVRRKNLQGIFVDFYEKNKPNKSCKLQDWEDNWKFAWVIRNAFAHGGSICWSDTRITQAKWDGFIYNREKDNGRDILFVDFGEADIILLLIDLG
jgi:hypothetical protein